MHETLQAHLPYRLLTDVHRCYRWCMLTKSSSIRQNETSRTNSLKTCHCKWLHAINVWWALATLPFHFSQGVIIFLQWPIMTMFRCRARNAVIWTCPMRRGCSFKQPPEASNSCRGWYVWKAAAIWPSVEKVAHADMLWKFRKLGMKGDNISDLLMIILFEIDLVLIPDSGVIPAVSLELRQSDFESLWLMMSTWKLQLAWGFPLLPPFIAWSEINQCYFFFNWLKQLVWRLKQFCIFQIIDGIFSRLVIQLNITLTIIRFYKAKMNKIYNTSNMSTHCKNLSFNPVRETARIGPFFKNIFLFFNIQLTVKFNISFCSLCNQLIEKKIAI